MKDKPTYDELLKQNERLLGRIADLEQSLKLYISEYNNLSGLFENSTIGMVICTTESTLPLNWERANPTTASIEASSVHPGCHPGFNRGTGFEP